MAGRPRYKSAEVLDFQYQHGDGAHNICCLQFLAISDREFSERLKANEKLQRTFDSVVDSSAKDIPIENDVEHPDPVVDLIECALLNRSRFACTQKWNFQKCFHNILEDEPTKIAMDKYMNDELEYVLDLVRRFDTTDTKTAKADLQRWLDTNVLDDGGMEDAEESADRLRRRIGPGRGRGARTC